MKKILVVGSTNTDMVISNRSLPKAGETISGGAFMMNPGGKGANQAVAVARLSAKKKACVFVAKVGDDLFGRETAARMRKDGVDARLCIDKKEPSGTALILVDAKGQNQISVALGANGTLGAKEALSAIGGFKDVAAVLMQLETPLETVLAVAEEARKNGVLVILNPAPAAKIPKKLYSCLDWITPNETEAEILTGVKVTDAASAAKAARVLEKRGVCHVLITMGVKGVFCGDCGKVFPARKVKAVDCVAAGDVFNGALVVALVEGLAVDKAIAFAQKAAAISVTRRGAQSSVPMRKEIV
jgi:ribokinase